MIITARRNFAWFIRQLATTIFLLFSQSEKNMEKLEARRRLNTQLIASPFFYWDGRKSRWPLIRADVYSLSYLRTDGCIQKRNLVSNPLSSSCKRWQKSFFSLNDDDDASSSPPFPRLLAVIYERRGINNTKLTLFFQMRNFSPPIIRRGNATAASVSIKSSLIWTRGISLIFKRWRRGKGKPPYTTTTRATSKVTCFFFKNIDLFGLICAQ